MTARSEQPAPDTGSSAPVQLTLFHVGPDVIAADTAPVMAVAGPDRDRSSQLQVDSSPHEQPAAAAPVRPQATTLRAAIEEYKVYLVALNRSKHTRDSFGLDLKLLLEHLGDVPLGVIAERDLRSFISWVRLQRHNSATSVRRKVASLKNFFSYLHRERAIASDPSLRLIYPEIYPALPEFLEDSKVEDLLAAAAEHELWHALLLLMLHTGLKRDEVVALGWTDVALAGDDQEPSYLVVRETEQAKRLRSRRLEISPEVTRVLRTFLAGVPRRERFFDISPRGVNFIVETCGKRARIATRGAKLTPQILRETFAVRHMRAMVEREDAARQAGVSEDAISLMIDQHDLQLLRMLGLHEEPESAKKYRKLVRGWSSLTQP